MKTIVKHIRKYPGIYFFAFSLGASFFLGILLASQGWEPVVKVGVLSGWLFFCYWWQTHFLSQWIMKRFKSPPLDRQE